MEGASANALPDPVPRGRAELALPEAPVDVTRRLEVRTVVLDPGHGGTDPGVAGVSGVLESVEFEASSEVEAGDLLFVIERLPYKALRDEALASLKAAKAELARAESARRQREPLPDNCTVPLGGLLWAGWPKRSGTLAAAASGQGGQPALDPGRVQELQAFLA